MADNKQNSETKNTGGNKTTSGAAASTGQAKEENSSANKTHNPTDSAVGKTGQSNETTASAKETLNKVKDSAGSIAEQAVGKAKEKAGSVIDEQKSNLAAGITSVADSIRQVGENLTDAKEDSQVAAIAGKYTDTLAGQVEKFSSYINDKEISELVSDVEKFARRNPLLFVGSAFALGILAARFLKSSSRNQPSKNRR